MRKLHNSMHENLSCCNNERIVHALTHTTDTINRFTLLIVHGVLYELIHAFSCIKSCMNSWLFLYPYHKVIQLNLVFCPLWIWLSRYSASEVISRFFGRKDLWNRIHKLRGQDLRHILNLYQNLGICSTAFTIAFIINLKAVCPTTWWSKCFCLLFSIDPKH